MLLAVILSSLIGIALGLLGGGGSILTVPILVYGLGLEAKPAIATSLLVVGVTSGAALVSHARRGLVDFRTGLFFGGAGMVGAFLGGRLASFIPGSILLLGFAAMMLATAVAMLRSRTDDDATASGPDRPAVKRPVARVIWHGSVVGVLTGLVGAGGGFLIVPALVLLGGMPMRAAVATSLLVIALKAFAGFAGYVGHVSIDWQLAALVTSAAVAGSVAGSLLSARIPQRALKRAFAWFVIAMALFVLVEELPTAANGHAIYQALFVERWPFWAGGLAIGAFVLLLLWVDNKLLGVSTGFSELCAIGRDRAARSSWRLRLLLGIVLGGALAGVLSGRTPSFALGSFDTLIGAEPLVKVPVLLGAGLLIGFGARTAGGCTSGHGIVGTALGAKSSLVATGLFMVGGFLATLLLGSLAAR
jgi:uncharacterized membrane protein YfcA/uncharacterized membrane protein YedE/YeeE